MFKNLKNWFSKKLSKNIDKNDGSGLQLFSTINGLNDNYLFDFKNYASQFNNGGGGGTFITLPSDNTIVGHDGNGAEVEPIVFENGISPSTKIKMKPIDVLVELETIPTPFNLTLLDEKISILKDKSQLITQVYAKREVDALIFRLQNRKKYNEFKSFFDSFANTNDEKIDALLSKYDLVMKTSDIFIPEFPDDAILIMKEYSEKMDLLCKKKPVFYVIAENSKFEVAYKKRDPILLVQSPFGFYWQILGAWDKEMLILSEL